AALPPRSPPCARDRAARARGCGVSSRPARSLLPRAPPSSPARPPATARAAGRRSTPGAWRAGWSARSPVLLRRLDQREAEVELAAAALDRELEAVAHLGPVDSALGVVHRVHHLAVHLADAVADAHAAAIGGAAALDPRHHEPAQVVEAQA